MSRGDPQQLRFDVALVGLADRVVSEKIATPVMRWRKMVRLFDPLPEAGCSPRAFQTVAGALADYADKNGSSCHPSVARLAEDTRLSPRTVQYALAALEARGLIVRDARGGRGRSSRYELLCRRLPVEKPVGDPVDDAQLTLDRAQVATLKGAAPCTRGPSERTAIYARPGLVRLPALGTAA